MHEVYLSLGSNEGAREQLIARAIELLGQRVGKVERQSSLIETEPWGFSSEHRFLNAAVLCLTELSPMEVLRATQQIERQLGRKTKTPPAAVENSTPRAESSTPHPTIASAPRKSYSDRPIDIDILLYDDITLQSEELTIPHPLMKERDFVMIPLNEIKH